MRKGIDPKQPMMQNMMTIAMILTTSPIVESSIKIKFTKKSRYLKKKNY